MFRRLFRKKHEAVASTPPAGGSGDSCVAGDTETAGAATKTTAASAATKTGAARDGAVDTVPPALAARRARVRALLVAEYDYDGLASFDLVEEAEVYCARLLTEDSIWSDTESADRVMEAAMADAIVRAQEDGLPREIAGQRLAAIFVACRTASEWEELPRAAAVAQDFVAAHLSS